MPYACVCVRVPAYTHTVQCATFVRHANSVSVRSPLGSLLKGIKLNCALSRRTRRGAARLRRFDGCNCGVRRTRTRTRWAYVHIVYCVKFYCATLLCSLVCSLADNSAKRAPFADLIAHQSLVCFALLNYTLVPKPSGTERQKTRRKIVGVLKF